MAVTEQMVRSTRHQAIQRLRRFFEGEVAERSGSGGNDLPAYCVSGMQRSRAETQRSAMGPTPPRGGSGTATPRTRRDPVPGSTSSRLIIRRSAAETAELRHLAADDSQVVLSVEVLLRFFGNVLHGVDLPVSVFDLQQHLKICLILA